jgi:hypothetical protein
MMMVSWNKLAQEQLTLVGGLQQIYQLSTQQADVGSQRRGYSLQDGLFVDFHTSDFSFDNFDILVRS